MPRPQNEINLEEVLYNPIKSEGDKKGYRLMKLPSVSSREKRAKKQTYSLRQARLSRNMKPSMRRHENHQHCSVFNVSLSYNILVVFLTGYPLVLCHLSIPSSTFRESTSSHLISPRDFYWIKKKFITFYSEEEKRFSVKSDIRLCKILGV